MPIFELQIIAGYVCVVHRDRHHGEQHVTVRRLDQILEEADALKEEQVA